MAKKRSKKKQSLGISFQKHEKIFWVIIGVLFIASSFTILSSVNETAVTGHATTQNIAFLKDGAVLPMEVKDVSGRMQVEIVTRGEIKNGQIVFEEVDKSSTGFDGKFFSVVESSLRDNNEIKSIELTWHVKESELKAKNLFRSQVSLFHNNKKLVTTMTKDDATETVTFVATAPELGEFVLGTEAPEVIKPTPKPPVEEEPEVQEPAPVVPVDVLEESVEMHEEVEEEKGFFAGISDFFSNLFN